MKAQPTQTYPTGDGLTLHYHAAGDPTDTPVLLLHGIGGDHRMWTPQIQSFPAAGYSAIVPDLRGHGSSERPEALRIEDCAGDMAGLLSSLHIERAHVVGVSMGGLVAQILALEHPRRVGKLVVADSYSCVRRPVERFNAWLAIQVLRFAPLRFQAHMLSDTYRAMNRPEVGQYLAERLRATPKDWLIAARRALSSFSVCARLGEIRAPTLVLVGDRFGALAFKMAQTTAEGIRDARLEILPGGGDPSNLVAPEAFDRAVLEFLSRHPRLD